MKCKGCKGPVYGQGEDKVHRDSPLNFCVLFMIIYKKECYYGKMVFWKKTMDKESRFDPILKRFYEHGTSGLVRENIQNFMDAHLDSTKPCIATIRTGIETENIPGYSEIFEHIKALKPENEYAKDNIYYMHQHLGKRKYRYVSFEDENTKGLFGAMDEDMSSSNSFYAYAYGKGIHYYEKDEDLDRIRSGSHGVGKIATNAASIFNTMFFANFDD